MNKIDFVHMGMFILLKIENYNDPSDGIRKQPNNNESFDF